MAEAPVVSVVMPVYNGERFLAEAVESILSQTFADFEFIIVDDGSVDGTEEILAKYARQDRRVRLVRLATNGGVTVALNQGISLSRGTLIARMDADDVSLPCRFEKQVQYLESHPGIAVVGSWFYPIDQNGRRSGVHYYPAEPGLVAWSMLFYNSMAHPTVMMRRDAIDVGAAYNVEYKNVEQDYDLFFRLSHVTRLANIPEPLLLYRSWEGNVSKRPDQASRILRNAVSRLDMEITEGEANALLGLSRDRYPSTPEVIRQLAELIQQFHGIYVSRFARDARDVGAITSDAAMKLWLLAALSARRAPSLTFSLAAAATRLRPFSVVPFASKVVARLASTRGR